MDEQSKKMVWALAVQGALAGGTKGKHIYQIADEAVAQFEIRFAVKDKADGDD